MIHLFLRAKHWVLFLLTFGIPFFLQIVFMGIIFGHVMHTNPPDPFTLFPLMAVMFVILIPFTLVTYLWQWAVVHGLQSFLPETVSLKVSRFRIFFFIPLLYFVLIMAGVGTLFWQMSAEPVTEPPLYLFQIFAVIFPVHLFIIFCLFYCIYFVAKTIRSVELQRNAEFGDFIGEFIMVWFFPIGIWILQPRINGIIDREGDRDRD